MTLDKLMSDYRKMILIQVEDMENFPDPEMWTDNLLIALRTISKKWILNELVGEDDRTPLGLSSCNHDDIRLDGNIKGRNQLRREIREKLG